MPSWTRLVQFQLNESFVSIQTSDLTPKTYYCPLPGFEAALSQGPCDLSLEKSEEKSLNEKTFKSFNS